MIIVDTNVVSELLRTSPEPQVEGWLEAHDGIGIYLTGISKAEPRYGVAVMGNEKRRHALAEAIERILREDMAGRIIAFDSAAAEAYTTIVATRRAAGRPITQADCQIAASARVQNITVATRNTADFDGCGIELINPWSESL